MFVEKEDPLLCLVPDRLFDKSCWETVQIEQRPEELDDRTRVQDPAMLADEPYVSVITYSKEST
jgi:hypothetical protein